MRTFFCLILLFFINVKLFGQCPTINFTINPIDATCSTSASGGLNITGVNGGLSPYQYSVDSGPFQNSNAFSGLFAGFHSVTIRDNNGCTNTLNTTIPLSAGALRISNITSTDITCFGYANGTITATSSGGQSPISYSVDGTNFQPSGNFSALAPANYTITIKDGNGCTITASRIITEPTDLVFDYLDIKSVACFGGQDGHIEQHVSGGTPPYEYSINGGTTFQTNQLFDTLRHGFYVPYVRDANGCFEQRNDTIWQPNEPLTIEKIYINANTCSLNGSADLTVIAKGGTVPYSYTYDHGVLQSSNTLNTVPSGTHAIEVVDNNGCIAVNNFTFNVPEPPNIVFDKVTDVYCGQNNGAIEVSTINGAGQNIFRWNTNPETKGDSLYYLSPGEYIVTVTDLYGCTDVDTTTIEDIYNFEVRAIIIDSATCGNNNGFIKIIKSGGEDPFFYEAINLTNRLIVNSDNNELRNIYGGLNQITIRDNTGCTWIDTVYVGDTPKPDINIFPNDTSITSIDTIILHTNYGNGGNGDSFNWAPSNALSCSNCPTPVAYPTETTKYYVYYTDSVGCKSADTILVTVKKVIRSLNAPSAFSPNGDNQNEVFYVNGLNISNVVLFRIYNRWGELLFEQNNFKPNMPEFGWDGTYKGKLQDPGEYVYYIESFSTDRRKNILKGDFLLLR